MKLTDIALMSSSLEDYLKIHLWYVKSISYPIGYPMICKVDMDI